MEKGDLIIMYTNFKPQNSGLTVIAIISAYATVSISNLQQGLLLDQTMLRHELKHILSYTPGDLKAASTSPIRMNNGALTIAGLQPFDLNPHATFSGWPPPHNILNDIKLPLTPLRKREPLGRIRQNPGSRLR